MRTRVPGHLRMLRRTPLFAGCSRRQLRRADRFCSAADVHSGQRLSVATERPTQLVVMVAGLAAAHRPSMPVRWLGPGDAFGAGTAFGSSCTVVAVTSGTVIAIAQNELAGFFGACPMVANRLNETTTESRARLDRVPANRSAAALIHSLALILLPTTIPERSRPVQGSRCTRPRSTRV
jgi:CRP-like cAMP-binding protein